MDTADCYKFYESKFKLTCRLLFCIIFIAGILLCFQKFQPLYQLMGVACLFIFGVIAISTFLKLFSHKVYVEITPSYIQIADFEKVLWSDVASVTDYADYHYHSLKHWEHWWMIDVKDISKYKLTLTQKLNGWHRHSAFYILRKVLSSKDCEQLDEIFQKYSPLYEHKSSGRLRF